METRIYHLVLWILVAYQPTLSAQQVHGGYSLWSNWSQCSRSCAGGAQSRSRTCTNPPPANGERDCSELGRATDFRKCNRHTCPVVGGFSDWSHWSECSITCGEGTQLRNRTCTNPRPGNNGTKCMGPANEIRKCASILCPTSVAHTDPCQNIISDQQCASWKNYCKMILYMQRSCAKTCGKCPDIPIHGGFTQWSRWLSCSKSCRWGTQYRYRSCTNPPPANKGRDCLGVTKESRWCNPRRCPVNGGYSQWSRWSGCSRSCGPGKKYRYRSCTNPQPAYGNLGCGHLGSRVESLSCNNKRCPVRGGYSQWSVWSQCSHSCGSGRKRRFRSCTNPRPAYGGPWCSRFESWGETRKCNVRPCPVDGSFSDWSSWSQCSVTCDNGTQQRNRSCSNPLPANGGKQCEGRTQETQICSYEKCPKQVFLVIHTRCRDYASSDICIEWKRKNFCKSVKDVQHQCARTCGRCKEDSSVDGGYTQWSLWSWCSKPCGGGTQTRNRSCTKPSPTNGGKACSGVGRVKESRGCNKFSCSVCRNSMDDTYCIKMKKSCSKNPKFRQYCKQTCKVCLVQSAPSSIQSPQD